MTAAIMAAMVIAIIITAVVPVIFMRIIIVIAAFGESGRDVSQQKRQRRDGEQYAMGPHGFPRCYFGNYRSPGIK